MKLNLSFTIDLVLDLNPAQQADALAELAGDTEVLALVSAKVPDSEPDANRIAAFFGETLGAGLQRVLESVLLDDGRVSRITYMHAPTKAAPPDSATPVVVQPGERLQP